MGVRRRSWSVAVGAFGFVAALGLQGLSAAAQDGDWIAVFDLPSRDAAPQVRGEHLETVALGFPDDRFRRLAARRESARAQGKARGVLALHRFVDDILATVQVHPRTASRIHAAIDQEAVEHAMRPLVDGSAAVQVRVALSVLRDAAPSVSTAEVPW